MSTNVDAALDFVVAYAGMLRTELPAARAHLAWMMPDGLAAHPTDTIGNSRTLESPVERIALRRHPGNQKLKALDDEIDAAVKVLRNLLNDCRRITNTTPVPPRCSATGRDGAIEWADPTCWNVPTRGTLCDKCSKREYRWRQARGLPARTDGVFAE